MREFASLAFRAKFCYLDDGGAAVRSYAGFSYPDAGNRN
jgi:hypothetical protein